jgi:hypothetical protein
VENAIWRILARIKNAPMGHFYFILVGRSWHNPRRNIQGNNSIKKPPNGGLKNIYKLFLQQAFL